MFRLDFKRIGTVPGLDGRDPAGGIDGVIGELALPCALAPGPVKATAFQFLAQLRAGDLVKENLKAVVFRIGNDFATFKLPALVAQLPRLGELLDPPL